MFYLLSFLFGFHLIVLVYFFTYLAVRAFVGAGSMPLYLLIGKHLIYWQLIRVGFGYLHSNSIIIGMVGAIYLSLPFFYWINRTYFTTE